MPDPSPEDFKKVAMNFTLKWNFNNCVGALGGKHVFIKPSPKSGGDFFNYKGRFSNVLLAMVDVEMKFLCMDVGPKGRFSNGRIFSSSFIGSRFKDSIFWPEDQPIHEGIIPMPFVAVDCCPLLKHLMRPYPGKQANIDRKKRVYNYRLSRARKVVESAFGILAT
ncbi:hypothetical protein J437_LFUL001783 [Ladona fulva]|uniref:DDE Tnp4 domain-containing protein n=1 Tax=Ladona fulva TaxID=123851 RepID=A0A8K0NY46_LADFU|nr:hypothetical protein J437_LFUL001783 [Ladona fulva]